MTKPTTDHAADRAAGRGRRRPRRDAAAAGATRVSTDEPPAVLDRLRSVCGVLPEAYEEPAWVGTRWRIRKRTFAHLRTELTGAGPTTWLKFRLRGVELDAVLAAGHPFFPAGYSRDTVGVIIDDDTDWAEVAELVVESYRLFAPKRLTERLDRAQGR